MPCAGLHVLRGCFAKAGEVSSKGRAEATTTSTVVKTKARGESQGSAARWVAPEGSDKASQDILLLVEYRDELVDTSFP